MHWREKARLRPRELAEVASVSVATIRRKIASGELESFTRDGMRFIPIGAALGFLGEAEPERSGSPSMRARQAARDFLAQIHREVE